MSPDSIVLDFSAVVIDVNSLQRTAPFWGALLGQVPGTPRSSGGWLTVGILEGDVKLVLQQVPEPKAVKNRTHLDFTVSDVDESIERIVALGGKLISGPRPGGGVTMVDPEGNEFCIGAFRRTKEGERISL